MFSSLALKYTWSKELLQTFPLFLTWSDWNVGPTLAIMRPVCRRQFCRELATFLCKKSGESHFSAHRFVSPNTKTLLWFSEAFSNCELKTFIAANWHSLLFDTKIIFCFGLVYQVLIFTDVCLTPKRLLFSTDKVYVTFLYVIICYLLVY